MHDFVSTQEEHANSILRIDLTKHPCAAVTDCQFLGRPAWWLRAVTCTKAQFLPGSPGFPFTFLILAVLGLPQATAMCAHADLSRMHHAAA